MSKNRSQVDTVLPYGFDPMTSHLDKDPWENLKTIQEFLRDRQAIPPDLAHWLGEAIRHSNKDPIELMQRLGLKKRRGKPASTDDAWLIWGGRVCELEGMGTLPEAALTNVANEYHKEFKEGIGRTTLQKWRDKFRKAAHP